MALLLTIIAMAGVMGCVGGPRPAVKVIGVSETRDHDATRMLVVFVEVQNPTKRPIQLARLEYRLAADPWFATHGQVPLGRSVSPGASAVLEIPVRVNQALADRTRVQEVAYSLHGTLIVDAGSRRARWPVSATGEISTQAPARSAFVAVPLSPQ